MSGAGAQTNAAAAPAHSPLTFAYDRVLRRPPRRAALLPGAPAIAVIASERLTMGLIFSAHVVPVADGDVSTAANGVSPAFVLVESCYVAQQGWAYAQCTPDGRERLRAALKPFRERGIPAVYWLTLDAAHYGNFRDVLADFDLVCVADPRALDRVQRDCPATPSIHLPPFVCASLHSPFRWVGGRAAGEAKGAEIVLDGWAEVQESPERFDHLSAIPQHALDIVDSRYALHTVKQEALPDYLRARVRGCLTFAQMAWAARHYTVALEDLDSLSSPMTRLQQRLEFLSCGLAISTCWSPPPELAQLVPSGAPVHTSDTPGEAASIAFEMSGTIPGPAEGRDRMRFVRRLWTECGLPARLSQMAKAAGIGEALPDKRYDAIFDGGGIADALQKDVARTYRNWPLQCIYSSNAIPAVQNAAKERFRHPRHFGSFWEASSRRGIDTILLARDRSPQEHWLEQLAAIKSAACADAAVLVAADNGARWFAPQYLDEECLRAQDGRLKALAMLISSEKLPRRPAASDLPAILAGMCKSRDVTIAAARDGDFGAAA